MPLLDHFHPPLENKIAWTTIFSAWSTHIADDLNEHRLSQKFVAMEIETWAPQPTHEVEPGRAPTWWFDHRLPEEIELHVFATDQPRKLHGVIALVLPTNKNQTGERRAFAAKTVAYLQQGISAVVIDIVTSKRFNLHNDIAELLAAPTGASLPVDQTTYTASYRPTFRDDKPQIDVWCERLAVGQPLPTMPLPLTGDKFVPVEFEATYMETCRRRRLL